MIITKPNITKSEWFADGDRVIFKKSGYDFVLAKVSDASFSQEKNNNAVAISALHELIDSLIESTNQLQKRLVAHASNRAEMEQCILQNKQALKKAGCKID